MVVESFKLIKESRKNIASYIFSSLLVSVGASFFVTGLSLVRYEYLWLIFTTIGIAFILMFIIYILFLIFKTSSFVYKIDGVIITKDCFKQIVDIPLYSCSYSFKTMLGCACNENSSINDIATKGNLNCFFINNKIVQDDLSSCELFKELVEYYLLNCLNICTEDHFNLYPSKELVKISRDNLPENLKKNKFLSLFSEPMDNRESFKNLSNQPGTIIECISNGAMYSEFSVALPKHTKISKTKDNIVCIKNKYFKLEFFIDFHGCSPVISFNFIENILKLDPLKLTNRKFTINFRVKYSRFVLNKRNFYLAEWIDHYVEYIKENVSIDDYFKNINWDSIEIMQLSSKTHKVNKQKAKSAKNKNSKETNN